MKKTGLLITAIIVAVVSAVTGYLISRSLTSESPETADHSKNAAASLIGTERPEFSLPDVEGKPRNVAEWDGHVVVINFWATWCPPCRDEIPEFITLQQDYSDKGIQFIGIALQKAQDVIGYIDELGVNYPILVGEQAVIDIARSYGNYVGALPYTVVIGRDTRIRYIKKGPVSQTELEPVIQSLL